ncbi:hypothetical protein EAL2_808p00130 (plasmid) [Peptoclostridium acidaminophilum DSM 3953]|uniref:Muconolactone isomerase domain-containing protein n=1 Tax=Peptoclostridium acidaminophilum DSM 3953 TaxID=1286171 RepID=W8T9C2_PEPAC|nr:muconolactone Delta-isomerase family protein [Peptoclostridium acidaminophilum]AHM57520.1 hypothetical protein EAL2_808p00130 [Peptoclostridium acidaminophilum DSM 3953]
MLFLVKTKVKEKYMPKLQELYGTIMEQMDMIVALQQQGKIVFSGKVAEQIASVLIMDMESRQELDESIQAMPGADIFEIEITPLEDFQAHLKAAKEALEAMKGIMNE